MVLVSNEQGQAPWLHLHTLYRSTSSGVRKASFNIKEVPHSAKAGKDAFDLVMMRKAQLWNHR